MAKAKELKVSYDISNKCDNLIFTKTKYYKLCYICSKNIDIIPRFVPCIILFLIDVSRQFYYTRL